MFKFVIIFFLVLGHEGWAVEKNSAPIALPDLKLDFLSQSRVAHDKVFLSDIATCQGEDWLCDELLAFPLINAPAPGQSKTLSISEVLSIVNSDWAKSKIEVSGSPHVQITADSQPSLKEDIEAFVARRVAAISEELHKEYVRVSLESLSIGNLPILRPGVQNFEIADLTKKITRYDHLPRSISIRLKASTRDSIYQVEVPVSLHLAWEEKQFVTVRDLNRGDQAQIEDFEERWIPASMSIRGKRSDIRSIAGKTVRLAMNAGSVVRAEQFDLQRIVDMGETVTAEILKDGLMVTAKSKALQHGTLGQIISIEHAATKKKYSARVKERGRVEVIGL